MSAGIFESFVEHISDGVILCDNELNHVIYMNVRAYELLHIPYEVNYDFDNINLDKLFVWSSSNSSDLKLSEGINNDNLDVFCETIKDHTIIIIYDLTSNPDIQLKAEKIKKIKELNNELTSIYKQYADDTILITDKNGIITFVGPAVAENCGTTIDDLMGRDVSDIEKEKIFYPSVVVRVIKSRRTQVVLQQTRRGKNLVAIGAPVFDNNGELSEIVSITRDFSRQIKIGTLISKMNGNDQKDSSHQKIDGKAIVTCDDQMLKVVDLAKLISTVDSTVLITGETGTGKEVLSNFIHTNSDRSEFNFVRVNCGAISKNIIESELFGYEPNSFTGASKEGKVGLIEASSNGTLFLDEVSELPMDQQVKLLHVLQESSLTRVGGTTPIDLNLRVIAATNKNLEEQVEKGEFREDLFYRLNVIPIHIPPLRERRDDIPLLIRHFLDYFNNKYDRGSMISKDAFRCLCEYDWPGNIRELRNAIERLVITTIAPYIEVEDIPKKIKIAKKTDGSINISHIIPLQDAIETIEKQLLQMAVAEYGTGKKIGDVLGINQSTVSRKLRQYGIISKVSSYK